MYTPRAHGQEFTILGICKPQAHALAWAHEESEHMKRERQERKKTIYALGELVHVRSYVVNTNHVDGLQIHSLYSTGVIAVASYEKRILITMFIATPWQIKRYASDLRELESLAYQHMNQGLTNT